jgi:localization factor PodJL
MRPGIPWSVKGIEPEAREAAKIAARRAGMTLGAWLTQTILDQGTDEMSPSGLSAESLSMRLERPVFPDPSAQHSTDRLDHSEPSLSGAKESVPLRSAASAAPSRTEAGMVDMLRNLASRLEASESRSERAFRDVDNAVTRIAERLERSQRRMEDSGSAASETLKALQGTVGEVAQRLDHVEQTTVRGETLRELEKAVSDVVDHIEQADARNGRAIRHIEHAVEDLVARLERLANTGDEATRDAMKSVERTLAALAERLEKVERKAAEGSQLIVHAEKQPRRRLLPRCMPLGNSLARSANA